MANATKQKPELEPEEERVNVSTSPGDQAVLDQIEAGVKAPSNTEQEEQQDLLSDAVGAPPVNEDVGSTKKRGWIYRQRKKLVVGGIVASLVGYGGFLFIQGPFQAIHFAQLLTQWHYTDNQDAQQSRVFKAIRWYKYRDDPLVRRLGKIKGSIAKSFDAKLTDRGFKPVLEPGSQKISGFEVDSSRVSQADLDELKRRGITVTRVNGIDFIDINGRYTFRQPVIKTMANFISPNKAASAITNRVLRKGYGAIFSPMGHIKEYGDKKLEARAKQKEEKKKQVEQEVKKGKRVPNYAGDAGQVNSDGSGTPKLDAVKANLGKIVSVAGVASLICTVKDIGDSVEEVNEANIRLPLIRTATRVISLGSQVMAGENFGVQELGDELASYYDPGTPDLPESDPNYRPPSSWMDAKSVQVELGKEDPQGIDIPGSARTENTSSAISEISGVLGSVGFIGDVCSFLGNPIADAAMTALDGILSIGTAGGKWLLTEFATRAFGDDIVNFIIGFLANEEVPSDAAGATLGNFGNFGARHAANGQAIAMGGVPLSSAQEAALDTSRRQELQNEGQTEGVAYRMLDLYNPNSAAAQTLAAIPAPQKLAGSTLNIVGWLQNSFTTLTHFFKPKASALSTNDYYGFAQYGFTEAELNSEDPTLDNPFANAEIVEPHLDAADGAENWNDKYGKPCFGVTVNESGFSMSPMRYNQIQSNSECTKQPGDPGYEELLRYRFFLLDYMTLGSVACFEGDESMCSQFGLGSTSTGSSVNGVECPSNLEGPDSSKFGYYRLPDAPNGEYTISASEARRYGQKELICVIYTVAKAFNAKYPDSHVKAGDLNGGAPHSSHRWGIAVDINTLGSPVLAGDHTHAGYSTEATIEFGKMFIDTGLIKNIWWCDPGDGSTQAIIDYARQTGKPLESMKCISGHDNHFHVDLNIPRGPDYAP